jgi:hypothetical protein
MSRGRIVPRHIVFVATAVFPGCHEAVLPGCHGAAVPPPQLTRKPRRGRPDLRRRRHPGANASCHPLDDKGALFARTVTGRRCHLMDDERRESRRDGVERGCRCHLMDDVWPPAWLRSGGRARRWEFLPWLARNG